MAYEYTFLSQIQPVILEMADLNAEEFNAQLSLVLKDIAGDVTKAIQTLPDGPWEAVSHSLTRFENHLIVTVLIRRELPSTE